MKKLIFPGLLILFLLCGCTAQWTREAYTERPEQPHLYWKDIDVVVTDVSRRHWFAATHRYEVSVTVESEEYQLTGTDTFRGQGFFGCPSQWNYNEGDTVKAELYSWVMDSTGEVVRREINQVY